MAPRRQGGEASLHLTGQRPAAHPGEGPVAEVEAEPLVLQPDEVEHRQARLVVRQAQATAELLQEHRGALGGAQEQHRVDLGDVDALVEQVHREQRPHLPPAQLLQRPAALLRRSGRRDRQRRDAGGAEPIRHVLGVADAHAEAERPHAADVGDRVGECLEDEAHPHVVAGEDVCQVLDVVPGAAPPVCRAQIGAVVQAEVLERRQQPTLQRLPQPQLHRDAATEPAAHVLTVGPLRRGGQTEQDLRLEVLQQPSVRGRLRVMELVDHHHVEALRVQLRRQVQPGQRLHRREHVPPLARPLPTHEALPERPVAQDVAERRLALAENLVTVGHEQQRVHRPRLPQAPVVEPRHDRLARPRGHHHQAVRPPVDLPLGGQLVEDLALVSPRPHVERGQVDPQIRRPTPLRGERPVEPGPLRRIRRVVRLERRVLPVLVERRPERVEQMPVRHRREPDVPLQPVEQCALRQVRRPDVRRAEPRVPVEQPRLRVQPRHPGLVRDAHLGPELRQPVDRPPLARPDVRRGDHPQPSTPAQQPRQVLLDHPHPVPLHERAQQIHPVCRRQLPLHLRPDPRLVPPVHQQRARRQRDLRPSRELRRTRQHLRCGDGVQQVPRVRHGGVAVERGGGLCSDGGEDAVGQRDLPVQRLVVRTRRGDEGSAGCVGDVGGEGLVRVRRLQGRPLHQVWWHRPQAPLQPCRDQLLVHPRFHRRRL